MIRWETQLPHALAAVELNKRHVSLVDALQPPYSFAHYRGIEADQREPTLAPWLAQGRLLAIGGQGTLDNHHMLYMDPLNRASSSPPLFPVPSPSYFHLLAHSPGCGHRRYVLS